MITITTVLHYGSCRKQIQIRQIDVVVYDILCLCQSDYDHVTVVTVLTQTYLLFSHLSFSSQTSECII